MGVSDQIRTATWADEKPIAALVGLAFATDPYVRWLLPDPYNYLRSNEMYVRQFSGPAFDNSSAFVIGNMCGAALWLPPGVKADSRPPAALNDEFIDPDVLDDLARLIEKSSAYRPLEPHWYLKFIAVDPVKRGRGYGAALMSHAQKNLIATSCLLILNPRTRQIFRFISAMVSSFWPSCRLVSHQSAIQCYASRINQRWDGVPCPWRGQAFRHSEVVPENRTGG